MYLEIHSVILLVLDSLLSVVADNDRIAAFTIGMYSFCIIVIKD